MIIGGLVLFVNLIIPHMTYSYKELEYKEITVINGDTLWSIAKIEQSENDYYQGYDIRDMQLLLCPVRQSRISSGNKPSQDKT